MASKKRHWPRPRRCASSQPASTASRWPCASDTNSTSCLKSDAIALTAGIDYLFERVAGEGTLPALPREGDAEQQPDFSQGSDVDLAGTHHSTAGFLELEWRPLAGTLLRIDKRWIYDSWMLGLYLDLQNVYDRANEDGVEYNYDYTKGQGTLGLPLIPVLGVRGEF